MSLLDQKVFFMTGMLKPWIVGYDYDGNLLHNSYATPTNDLSLKNCMTHLENDCLLLGIYSAFNVYYKSSWK